MAPCFFRPACVDFLAMAAERIPNLAGIKFTCANIAHFGQCLRLNGGRFNVLLGRDDLLLAGLALGAHGAVGTNYNIAALLYRRIMDAYDAGDLATARAEQARAVQLEAILSRLSWLPAAKTAMKMIGVDCGPVRLPLRSLSSEEYDLLYTDLVHLGFLTFCSRAG